MRSGLSGMVIWYTFLAVMGYLLLTNWKGANALLGTGVGGYVSAVRALQGRGSGVPNRRGR